MSIELTEQQAAELMDPKDSPPRVFNRQTSEVFVLVPESDYESIREMLEEERQQRIIHAMFMRNAALRAEEEP